MSERLGKLEYKPDDRTARLATWMADTVVVPKKYDFDRGRAPFPLDPWGNEEWGDCVRAGRCNHTLRLERIETRRTVHVTADQVINSYKHATGAVSPGDANDNGLVVLDDLNDWRQNGWTIGGKGYTIAAFGELDPTDFEQLKSATYLFHGIQLGFWLPRAVQGASEWTYHGETGPEWKAGSWGGHLVYSKMYADGSAEVLSWGRRIRVSKEFIAKYADEAWAVVDSLDVWRRRPEFDVQGLIKHLHDIGATIR